MFAQLLAFPEIRTPESPACLQHWSLGPSSSPLTLTLVPPRIQWQRQNTLSALSRSARCGRMHVPQDQGRGALSDQGSVARSPAWSRTVAEGRDPFQDLDLLERGCYLTLP